MSEETVISVHGLKNAFGEQIIHDGLEFDVRRGEIFGVVGGSGTGKSVLMRSIIGLQTPVAGEIEVLGENMIGRDEDEAKNIRRRWGILFQNGVKGTITRVVASGHVGFGDNGVRVQGFVANTTTTANIADSTFDGNGSGVVAFSNNAAAAVKVSVRDSRAVRNADGGLIAFSAVGGAVSLSASNNIVANNINGITAIFAGAKVWASGNTVSDNAGSGLVNNAGLFTSVGNNAIYGNGVNISGAITTVATQ